MAVAENGVASGAQHFETTDLEQSNGHHTTTTTTTTTKTEKSNNNNNLKIQNNNGDRDGNNSLDFEKQFGSHENGACEEEEEKEGGGVDEKHQGLLSKGGNIKENGGKLSDGEGLKREIAHLEEMLTKLNPMAKEFVPPSLVGYGSIGGIGNNGFGYGNNFLIQPNPAVNVIGFNGRRRRNNYGQEKRRMNSRTSMAQREDVIRRTVYVSDIDQQVTEEHLAALFINCGQVVDCRICGDPNSILRFAFVEFTDEDGAQSALSMSSTLLGYYPVRVLPSKTAIAPVNPTFLPKSEDEREMCARTVYCTNIDKKVTQAEIRNFFESFCGEVRRLRLLGDYHHSTRIAFVEFVIAESAIAALNCSGAVLGSLPIRVSPSKTPVRPRPPRSPLQ